MMFRLEERERIIREIWMNGQPDVPGTRSLNRYYWAEPPGGAAGAHAHAEGELQGRVMGWGAGGRGGTWERGHCGCLITPFRTDPKAKGFWFLVPCHTRPSVRIRSECTQLGQAQQRSVQNTAGWGLLGQLQALALDSREESVEHSLQTLWKKERKKINCSKWCCFFRGD